MDTRLILVLALGLVLVCLIGLALFIRRRQARRHSSRITATITQVQVEAGSLSSWWVVTAQWVDPQTGQTLIFHSSRLRFPPKKHPGEEVTVEVDPNDPRRYHMEL